MNRVYVQVGVLFVFFFFSSRRRHTRLVSDWSSDVCSSDLLAAAPPLFILPISRCGSAPAFYTDRQRHEFFTARISLRQRPRFLYCPDLLAAAPPLLILPIPCCGSALPFILTNSRCGSTPAIYTDHFSLRQRPRFLYCPDRKSGV